MMRLKSALVLLLSLVVIASSFSFTIEKHFCSGKHVDSAIFSETSCDLKQSKCDNCHEVKKPQDKDERKKKPGCCERDITPVVGNDFQITIPRVLTLNNLDLTQDNSKVNWFVIGQNLNPQSKEFNLNFIRHLRPLVQVNIQLLFEHFLL